MQLARSSWAAQQSTVTQTQSWVQHSSCHQHCFRTPYMCLDTHNHHQAIFSSQKAAFQLCYNLDLDTIALCPWLPSFKFLFLDFHINDYLRSYNFAACRQCTVVVNCEVNQTIPSPIKSHHMIGQWEKWWDNKLLKWRNRSFTSIQS